MIRFLTFLVFILLYGCTQQELTFIEITDVSKPDTIVLFKDKSQRNIHSISIEISGDIDGKAEMIQLMGGAPYNTQNVDKSFKFRWGGDWYSDSAIIIYTPSRVTKGKLKIAYRFNEIQ